MRVLSEGEPFSKDNIVSVKLPEGSDVKSTVFYTRFFLQMGRVDLGRLTSYAETPKDSISKFNCAKLSSLDCHLVPVRGFCPIM